LATDVMMPRLSDSMEEGTVLKWLVDQGGEVKRGEPLVEIETDKANMTYEADTDGVLIEVVAKEGETLPIGEVIARIGEPGEKPSGDGAAPAKEAEQEKPAAEEAEEEEPPPAEERDEEREPETAPTAEAEPAAGGDGAATAERRAPTRAPAAEGDGRVKASPVARRMAREMGVELARLEGTGPGGRIVKADVEAAARGGAPAAAPAREAPAEEREAEAPARPAAPEPVAAGEAGAKGELRLQELTRLQKTVSRRMAESKATAPDYQLNIEIDMSACVELRGRLKEISDPAPSFNDMVVKACARALRESPRVNGAYRDGRFELYSRVNVGVAVAAQDTLIVPTIFDADQKSLGEIARTARELVGKVREGKITPPELSGGTFTVSNLGMYGIESFSAVINPPQAAILTVGALKKKPVVDDRGRIAARDMMSVTLICDHRILYGADGAEFLSRVRELLEQPLALAL
jgi:pyruvate dehydrogenase E2 component (dihydrolipoamide acetyltransferase)